MTFTSADKEWIDSIVHMFETIYKQDFITVTYDIKYYNSFKEAKSNIVNEKKHAGSAMTSYRMMWLNEKILSASPRAETLRTIIHEVGHILKGADEKKVLAFEKKLMP